MTGSLDPELAEAAGHLLRRVCTDAVLAHAEAGHWPAALWDEIEAFGLASALVSENGGGLGLDLAGAWSLLGPAGASALPLPLAETMLARGLLEAAGLPAPKGPATIAFGPDLSFRHYDAGLSLRGRATRVPWGRSAAVVVLAEHEGALWIALPCRDDMSVRPGENIAKEPRDTVVIDARLEAQCARVSSFESTANVKAVLAAARCAQMAGAMGEIAAMTVRYALERVQFGRPIGKFQAVQQTLAVLAEHAAAARAAADLAAEASVSPIRRLAIAAAKARVSEAAGLVAALAHQVHGAMGFTAEHRLHFLTQRLWSWRDEHGNESRWATDLGGAMAHAGPDGLWAAITAV